jgi:catechol 1,2-dioxygenase
LYHSRARQSGTDTSRCRPGAAPHEYHEFLSSFPLFPSIDAHLNHEENTMNNRGEQVVGELRRRITALVADFGITYDEYQTAIKWMIEVGEAGEWPLVLALFEHAVEQQAHKDRAGSEGTILGPFYLPGAPVLQAPYELPRRPDEKGERLLITGRVLSADGTPLPGAVLDVWHSDADGLYSGFSELPAGILRGKVITDTQGRFELRTIVPVPYTVPHNGPFGQMLAACRWHPWRPAHVHLIVSADEHEQLITQLFLGSSDYLDDDVAGAVKDSLIVHPQRRGDQLALDYEFRLAPTRAAVPVG